MRCINSCSYHQDLSLPSCTTVVGSGHALIEKEKLLAPHKCHVWIRWSYFSFCILLWKASKLKSFFIHGLITLRTVFRQFTQKEMTFVSNFQGVWKKGFILVAETYTASELHGLQCSSASAGSHIFVTLGSKNCLPRRAHLRPFFWPPKTWFWNGETAFENSLKNPNLGWWFHDGF